jgi:hypothetical protein
MYIYTKGRLISLKLIFTFCVSIKLVNYKMATKVVRLLPFFAHFEKMVKTLINNNCFKVWCYLLILSRKRLRGEAGGWVRR